MKRIITLLAAVASFQISAQCIQKIAAGASYTAVVKADGTLWAWGRNNYGQLGNGNTTNTGVKTRVGTATDWQSVYAGQYHTLGIKTNNTLWAWGKNTYGELGNNTTNDRSTPIQIGTASWQTISAGEDHTLGIQTDGSLWGWGLNDKGQLGNGSENSSVPVRIDNETNWQSVAAGDNYTLAIKTDGTLWAWGNNGSGQVGDGGAHTVRYFPVQIGTDTNWQSVTAGNLHSLAIKTNGTLWAWGSNGRGQLGDGTTTAKDIPTQIGTDTDWAMVDSGFFYSVALKTNGTLWTWGWGTYYSVGQGDNQTNVLAPTQVGTDTNWLSISSGQSALFGHALKANGALWGWGYNNYSQLGNGTTVSGHVPAYITCPASTSLTAVACESYTWVANAQTYTQSGIYIDTASNDDLQLNINNGTVTTTTETACETYTWAVNGQIYTESGNYVVTSPNANGCTDTATLSLTVNHNTTTNIAETACDSYTWADNGTTYTTSGVYTNTVTVPSGCTNTATLNLTINNSTSSSLTETACDNYFWIANGATYSSSGAYTNITTNASGCTDTATLNLTINNSDAPVANSTQTISGNISSDATISDIVISPSTVVWYASQSDALEQVNPLNAASILTNGATYYAVNTNGFGCPSAPFPVTITVALGTDSFDNADFNFYPNPASDRIFIKYSDEISKLSVYNLLGQEVFTKSIHAKEGTIEISNLPRATYLVKVYSGNSVKALKVIKQ